MSIRHTRAGFNTLSGYGLNAFTDRELETVHAATLQVLRNTGIKVETTEALDILEAAGAAVERKEKYGLVKIPEYIVEECLASTPKTGLFFGRRPEDDYFTDANSVAFTAGFGEHVKIIDPHTREVRPTTKADLGNISRIQDALSVTPIVERAACSGDCTPAAQPVHNYAAMVKNTSKHCFLGFGGKRNTEVIIEIAKAAVGGEENFKHRPTVTGFVCPTSPLSMVNECCESIIACAKAGIGISIIPMSLSGASSPATLAGVMVQHNAEVISAIILAQFIHNQTHGIKKTFVQINCAAIPEQLLEAELFGYEKGAFTGASEQGKMGLFEMAKGGTLFLDELGEMSLPIQAKLLKCLEDMEVMHLGGLSPVKIECSVIAATDIDLKKQISRKTFRQDLYFRLNTFAITLPPLRRRPEDVFEMIIRFSKHYRQRYGVRRKLSRNFIKKNPVLPVSRQCPGAEKYVKKGHRHG